VHYPAGKLGDAVAQMELQHARGFHPYHLTPVKLPAITINGDFNP
jgi:hypothetical protein